MKHVGSTMEYSGERMAEIMKIYNDYISSCKQINIPYICRLIADMPARRFWVSEIWAGKVVSAIMKGKHPYYNMRPLRREMFQEIFRRVTELREKHPGWSVNRCCAVVVAQPAPKFYLTAETIRVMICKEKVRIFKERKKRLRHCF